MKTIFAATVLTAALGLTACDAAPEAALIEPPAMVATAAAEEKTPEAVIAEADRLIQVFEVMQVVEQLCDRKSEWAQTLYQARLRGWDRQQVLTKAETVFPAEEQLFVRRLVGVIYTLPPAVLTADMPAAVGIWVKEACYQDVLGLIEQLKQSRAADSAGKQP